MNVVEHLELTFGIAREPTTTTAAVTGVFKPDFIVDYLVTLSLNI